MIETPLTTRQPGAPARSVRVLLYGDVNLNILDGSAVWLTSMARTWTMMGAQVDVVLKATETRTLLSGELREVSGVRVHPARPPRGMPAMPPAQAAELLRELDGDGIYDVVMVRGIRICRTVARRGDFAGRLWSYVTEFGYPDSSDAAGPWDLLGDIAAASRLMLAQTEQARAVLEAMVPEAAGRTVVLSPMVPDALTDDRRGHQVVAGAPLSLVYTGKFARQWRTDLMPQIVTHLAELGVSSELTMVGDKIQDDPAHPEWAHRMASIRARSQQGVHWTGPQGRSSALSLTAGADLSLGWRDESLDTSLEISTKVLESCALGVPPVVNRTAAHEDLLGADYPLFVDGATDGPEEIARTIAAARPMLALLTDRVRAAAEPYRMSVRAQVLRDWTERVGRNRFEGIPVAGSRPRRAVRLVIAGHDLKFAGELVDLLTDHPEVELRLDRWSSLHHHDEATSRRLVDWADVVMCEWVGPNAVWYARHKRPGQRLVARLHMFELRGQWLSDLETAAVDRFVTVSEHYRQLLIQQLMLDQDQVSVIPNAISVADLDRPGLPDRRHRLGLVGMVPLRKRLDRALDLLRELHRSDPRYTLHVRGRLPWEYRHEWIKPIQREAYLDMFARLGRDPLRHAVAFEPFGADMAGWLRKIGWVLSPSTVESFHLAPAEGMAAGAIPVIWERPGADDIFGSDLVVRDTAAAARRILEADADREARADLEALARTRAARFDERTVADAWEAILLRDR